MSRSENTSGRNPMGVGGEKPLEIRDYYLDSFEDLLKARTDLIVTGCAKNSLFEKYAEEKIKFHVHLRLSRAGIFSEYCIVFNSALDGGIGNRNGDRIVNSESRANCDRLGHRDQLVFISRVKFLKHPEHTSIWIRSCIRLQRADVCQGVRVYSPQAPRCVVKLDNAPVDREHCLDVTEVASGQPPSNVVKGAARVMDGIAKNQPPGMLWGCLKHLEPENILGSFSIVLMDHGIRISTTECAEFSVESIKVFLPATKLEPRLF
jgi:hypothetical protein